MVTQLVPGMSPLAFSLEAGVVCALQMALSRFM